MLWAIFYMTLTKFSALPCEPERSHGPETADPAPSAKEQKKKKVNGPVFCSFCATKFDKPGHLQAHMRGHVGRHKYDTCERTFAEPTHLAIHGEVHDTTPRTCPDCGKVLAKETSYLSHCKLHKKHRPRVECPHVGCDKTYSQQAVLNRHMKIVSGVCAYHSTP